MKSLNSIRNSKVNNIIETEIRNRIHEKIRQGIIFSTREISSITLGINVYNELRDQIESTSMAIFSYTESYRGPEILGHKIRICYKRKNLIQINIKRSKKHKWITIDYANNLNLKSNDYNKMVAFYGELKSLSKKYPVSFLTSQ